jgi:heavy metal translocating P-type ATPase
MDAQSGPLPLPIVRPANDQPAREGRTAFAPLEVARILFVAATALAIWIGLPKGPFAVLVALGGALGGGYPIAREALEGLRARRMTMELSMLVAVAAAVSIGETTTALVVLLFVLVAEQIEHLTVGRGRRALSQLLALLPTQVTVVTDGIPSDVEAGQLRSGDVVLVRPGARIPVDGRVVGGHSFVDQSSITGEPAPVEKGKGSTVYAGSMNQQGSLRVETEKVGAATAYGKIVHAVEMAEKSRAPVQKLADRLAGALVYAALACAALTYLLSRNLTATISVVIVAGACGVAAGTPLAILGGIGRLAKAGAVIKGGRFLEALGRIDTVVLDKTGTLTLGRPEVIEVRTCPGVEVATILEVAAGAERFSEHPLGKAILRKAESLGITGVVPEDFTYTPGGGVSCRLSGERVWAGSRYFLAANGINVSGMADERASFSEVLVARGTVLLGAIAIADRERPDAKPAVAELREMGLRVVLLTGDAETATRDIAGRLGFTEWKAGLLPDQKLQWLKQCKAEGARTAMVGDGVNDVPALLAAEVGIGLGSGTDLAQESAGVVLLGDDLGSLVAAFRIARQCRHTILTNFWGTVLVDAVGMALAAFGVLGPLPAALVHVTSELGFILNSARLLPSVVGRGRDKALYTSATKGYG